MLLDFFKSEGLEECGPGKKTADQKSQKVQRQIVESVHGMEKL